MPAWKQLRRQIGGRTLRRGKKQFSLDFLVAVGRRAIFVTIEQGLMF
jgi:hypothetical protein